MIIISFEHRLNCIRYKHSEFGENNVYLSNRK